jgi:hypothetical protein
MLTTTQPMRSDRFEIIFFLSDAIQYTVKPKRVGLVQSRHHIIISKVTCFRHDIAEKLLI